MSDEEERNGRNERDAERLKWELNDIRDDLMDELDDLQEDFVGNIEDILEDADDIKDDLKDDLEEFYEERDSLLNEFGDVREELGDLGDGARERIDHAREKLDRLEEKVYRSTDKFREKIRRKIDKAKRKAVKRINISVDEDMSEDWKSWSEELGSSVSELVRKSMMFVKDNIGDLKKLEAMGEVLDQIGDDIEKAVEESGIENLEIGIKPKKPKAPKPPKMPKTPKAPKTVKTYVKLDDIPSVVDKERLKKRVEGLIKLQKAIPVDKLAHALSIAPDEAENLIYELVAEGIEGSLEEGVFKFTSPFEEVVSKLNELIDRL